MMAYKALPSVVPTFLDLTPDHPSPHAATVLQIHRPHCCSKCTERFASQGCKTCHSLCLERPSPRGLQPHSSSPPGDPVRLSLMTLFKTSAIPAQPTPFLPNVFSQPSRPRSIHIFLTYFPWFWFGLSTAICPVPEIVPGTSEGLNKYLLNI